MQPGTSAGLVSAYARARDAARQVAAGLHRHEAATGPVTVRAGLDYGGGPVVILGPIPMDVALLVAGLLSRANAA